MKSFPNLEAKKHEATASACQLCDEKPYKLDLPGFGVGIFQSLFIVAITTLSSTK